MTINTAFFEAIAHQAENCVTCADVQRLADQALPQLQTVIDAINAQITALTAAQALLSLNPADLPGVISFVSSLKTDVIAPLIAPYAAYITQATQTASAVTTAIAAVQAAADRIAGCTITLP